MNINLMVHQLDNMVHKSIYFGSKQQTPLIALILQEASQFGKFGFNAINIRLFWHSLNHDIRPK